FNGAVQLSASGLPTGAAASFSPNPATSTSTMTVTTSSTTPTGSSTLTVTGTNGNLSHTTTTALVVTAPHVVSGTAKDGAGAPVSGGWVYAYQGGAGAVCCTNVGAGMTDSNGSYSMVLPAGTYKFWVNPPAPFSAQWYGGGGVEVATGVQVSGSAVVCFTLVARYTVSGKVKDGD